MHLPPLLWSLPARCVGSVHSTGSAVEVCPALLNGLKILSRFTGRYKQFCSLVVSVLHFCVIVRVIVSSLVINISVSVWIQRLPVCRPLQQQHQVHHQGLSAIQLFNLYALSGLSHWCMQEIPPPFSLQKFWNIKEEEFTQLLTLPFIKERQPLTPFLCCEFTQPLTLPIIKERQPLTLFFCYEGCNIRNAASMSAPTATTSHFTTYNSKNM